MGCSKNQREDPFSLKPLIPSEEIPSEGLGPDPKDPSSGQKRECFFTDLSLGRARWPRSEGRALQGRRNCSLLAFNLLRGFRRAKPRSNPNCSYQQPPSRRSRAAPEGLWTGWVISCQDRRRDCRLRGRTERAPGSPAFLVLPVRLRQRLRRRGQTRGVFQRPADAGAPGGNRGGTGGEARRRPGSSRRSGSPPERLTARMKSSRGIFGNGESLRSSWTAAPARLLGARLCVKKDVGSGSRGPRDLGFQRGSASAARWERRCARIRPEGSGRQIPVLQQ